jgi:hypothetical protein
LAWLHRKPPSGGFRLFGERRAGVGAGVADGSPGGHPGCGRGPYPGYGAGAGSRRRKPRVREGALPGLRGSRRVATPANPGCGRGPYPGYGAGGGRGHGRFCGGQSRPGRWGRGRHHLGSRTPSMGSSMPSPGVADPVDGVVDAITWGHGPRRWGRGRQHLGSRTPSIGSWTPSPGVAAPVDGVVDAITWCHGPRRWGRGCHQLGSRTPAPSRWPAPAGRRGSDAIARGANPFAPARPLLLRGRRGGRGRACGPAVMACRRRVLRPCGRAPPAAVIVPIPPPCRPDRAGAPTRQRSTR